ncbi:hypothetical protein TNCV_4414591 [Trichonephila clavipes]|uniref:Uncharacterized protein n=1 Tax=Trichonephila clavipes TaxID=2585209 RepID=A0A8X6S9F2_TRICX|nr:hypothetical protein TNCV_4414591 [Trichonephila clavipes]
MFRFSFALVAAVAEWYRYRTVACLVTSSSPVPLKTRPVGEGFTLNLSKAETSSRWCGGRLDDSNPLRDKNDAAHRKGDYRRVKYRMRYGHGRELMSGVVKSRVRVLMPLKTHRAKMSMHVQAVLPKSSGWPDVEALRGRCRSRCRPLHRTVV